MSYQYRRIANRQMKIAWRAFWDWYCHDNRPAPEWWRQVGPYKNWLDAVGETHR